MNRRNGERDVKECSRQTNQRSQRTFCRLALRFGQGRSEGRVCCLWKCRRELRETVVQGKRPVASARPSRCCKRTDVDGPRIGRGIRDQRKASNRCAAGAAAGAAFLDSSVSKRPQTAAGHSTYGEKETGSLSDVHVAVAHPRSCT